MLGLREFLAGILIVFGLGLVGVVLMMAFTRNPIEAFALGLPSIVVFRSGVGLLRMTTAARIAMKLREPRIRS